jgi:hypothetical protein
LGGEKISTEELSKEPFILREIGSGTLNILEGYLKAAGSKGLEALQPIARFGTSTAVRLKDKKVLKPFLLRLMPCA